MSQIIELCENIHNVMPRVWHYDSRTINTIACATSFVDFVTGEYVYGWETELFSVKGESFFSCKVKAPNVEINKLLDLFYEKAALFSLNGVSQTRTSGFDVSCCTFVFGSYRGLDLHCGIALDPTDNDPTLKNRLTYDISKSIIELMTVDTLAQSVTGDAIRWFADRLGDDEIPGEHIQILQDFLYRRAHN